MWWSKLQKWILKAVYIVRFSVSACLTWHRSTIIPHHWVFAVFPLLTCFSHPGAHLRDVLLQGVGLSHTSLSKSTSDYLSALVDNAVVLGIRDTSLGRYTLLFYHCIVYFLCHLFPVSSLPDEHVLSSFMPAVNSLTNDLLEAEKSNRRLERELRALRKRLGATLVLRSNLQE